MFVLAAAALLACGVRLAYIQIGEGPAWAALAEKQQVRTYRIPATRGSILDSEGRPLAISLRRPSLFVDPTLLTDIRFAAHSLAPILRTTPEEIESTLQRAAAQRTADGKPSAFEWLQREITIDQSDRINEICEARGLRAFGIQDELVREYPQGRLASHVLGFFSAGGAGGGVELQYDKEMRGKDGSRTVVIDQSHNRLSSTEDGQVAPVDGHSVILTIDSHIQKITERHLRAAMDEFKADWGLALVMDPHTGEVLASAGLPDFDPARPIPPGAPEAETAAIEALRNRALGVVYEPGSIFKPFVAGPAFDQGLARLDDVFEINGGTRMFGRRAISDTKSHSRLSLVGVIAQSSNIGMAMLGDRLGAARVHQFVSSFGFGKETGIDLPGEERGILRPLDQWTSYSPQSIPMGHELAATGIQLLAAFAVFANDGVLFQPRVVRGVVSARGATVADHSKPLAVRRVMSPEGARAFRSSALVEVVREGTGKRATIPDYQVFGKTGTAEIAATNRKGYKTDGSYVGSFIGGAPADDPRAIVLVSIYRPRGGKYYGGTVAAPSVGAILADTLSYLRVPRDAASEVAPAEVLP